MKNGEVTRIVPLEVEVNRHKKHLKVAVTDLNGIDIFLGHDWLVKHNPESKLERWQDQVYKMSEFMQNKTPRYQIQDMENTDNRNIR